VSSPKAQVGSIVWVKARYYTKPAYYTPRCFTCGKEIIPRKEYWRRDALLNSEGGVVEHIYKSPHICDECMKRLVRGGESATEASR